MSAESGLDASTVAAIDLHVFAPAAAARGPRNDADPESADADSGLDMTYAPPDRASRVPLVRRLVCLLLPALVFAAAAVVSVALELWASCSMLMLVLPLTITCCVADMCLLLLVARYWRSVRTLPARLTVTGGGRAAAACGNVSASDVLYPGAFVLLCLFGVLAASIVVYYVFTAHGVDLYCRQANSASDPSLKAEPRYSERKIFRKEVIRTISQSEYSSHEIHRTISESEYWSYEMHRTIYAQCLDLHMYCCHVYCPLEDMPSPPYKATILYRRIPEPSWTMQSAIGGTCQWEQVSESSLEYRQFELYFKIIENRQWKDTWKQVWKLVIFHHESLANLLSTSNSTSSTSTSASTSSTSSSASSTPSNVSRKCVAMYALRVVAAIVAVSAALCLVAFIYDVWSARTALKAAAPNSIDFFVAAWLSFDQMAIDNAAALQIPGWRIRRRWCRVCTCICPTWRPSFDCRLNYFDLCYLFSLCTWICCARRYSAAASQRSPDAIARPAIANGDAGGALIGQHDAHELIELQPVNIV